ncbi:MAG TPA: hypothetical protein VFX15_03100 [Actinomycetes bacterium]|nr:hypothetical protein [Actinomycetes bacterium]
MKPVEIEYTVAPSSVTCSVCGPLKLNAKKVHEDNLSWIAEAHRRAHEKKGDTVAAG